MDVLLNFRPYTLPEAGNAEGTLPNHYCFRVCNAYTLPIPVEETKIGDEFVKMMCLFAYIQFALGI